MPAPRKCNAETDDAFFAALARGTPVSVAAALARCTRQALYRWRIADAAFDGRWRATLQALAVRRRRALRRKRGLAGALRDCTDRMLLRRLKLLRPAQYRD